MKKIVTMLALCASVLFCDTLEYGFYQDNKNKKVYLFGCDYGVSRNIFFEWEATQKGGIFVKKTNDDGCTTTGDICRLYANANCDEAYNRLQSLVREGKLKRVGK